MVGLNKFFIFDQNKLNIVDDNAYQQSTYRVNGAVTGVAPSTIHNKLFYQSSIMASAIAQVVANRGLDAVDGDFDNLVTALTSVIDNSVTSRNWKALNGYNVGEVIYSNDIVDSMKFFECTVAGTSGNTEPAWGAVGTTIADGTATWTVRDVRDARKLQTARNINGVAFDGTADISIDTGVAITTRQTVLSGAVDVNGQANFLQIGSGLSVNELATSIPTVTTWANGYDASGSVDYVQKLTVDVISAWSGLTANSTLYLYKERNANTGAVSYGFTALQPIYQGYAPSIPTANQYWFDTVNMIGQYWTGSVWSIVQRVFVGECVTGASTIANVISYAFKGVYISPLTTLQGISTKTVLTSNLGINPMIAYGKLVCQTADSGYAVGDCTDVITFYYINPFYSPSPSIAASRNTISFTTSSGQSNNAYWVFNKTTGASATIVTTNWKYILYAFRGW